MHNLESNFTDSAPDITSKFASEYLFFSHMAGANELSYSVIPMAGHVVGISFLSSLFDLIMICLNTLRPRQNGRHFADNMFKCIFLNEYVWILNEISPKFVPKGSINNNPALFQIRLGAVQATSYYLNQWCLVHWRIYASLGLNELSLLVLGSEHAWCLG